MVSKSLVVIASSRSTDQAWRRACRPPRLPSVISFSTIGRSSLAFGKVVEICSCLISAADMLANIALRWLAVRFSFRFELPWRICYSSGGVSRRRLVMIFVAFGQSVDVLWRPVRVVHAEMETHLGENFLDLVERLAAEVRGPEHLRLGLLDEVADVNDVVVLEAVGRTDRELELVDLLEQRRVEGELGNGVLGLLLGRLFEIHEDRELVLEDAGGESDRVFRRDRA